MIINNIKSHKITFYSKDNNIKNCDSNTVSNNTDTNSIVGATLLSNQISFGLNRKNIKNYNNDEVDFLAVREQFTRKFHRLNFALQAANWDFYTNSTEENELKLKKAITEFDKLLEDKKIYDSLQKLLCKDIKNPLLKRELIDLINNFNVDNPTCSEPIDIDISSILQKFNSYIPMINGKETSMGEVDEILSHSKDESLLKQAYEASVNRGELIADDMINLVKNRNKFAQKKGYKNYFEYMLKIQHNLDADNLSKMFDELSEAADKTYAEYYIKRLQKLKKVFKKNDLEPQHYQFDLEDTSDSKVIVLIKSKEEITSKIIKMYKNMGWDIENMPIELDLYPRKNKATTGMTINTDGHKESKILANLARNTYSIMTLSHELGHAVYNLGISGKIPYLAQTAASSAMTEAVAEMMGDLYIKENPLDLPEKLSKELKKQYIYDKAAFIKQMVFLFEFEKALYENPNQDVPKLWYNLKKKYLKSDIPKKLNNDWCNIEHFIFVPGYCQSYLRANIIAMQLYDTATKKLGPLTQNPKTAAFFNKLFKTGDIYDEDETLKRFTGEGFSIDAYKKLFLNLKKYNTGYNYFDYK